MRSVDFAIVLVKLFPVVELTFPAAVSELVTTGTFLQCRWTLLIRPNLVRWFEAGSTIFVASMRIYRVDERFGSYYDPTRQKPDTIIVDLGHQGCREIDFMRFGCEAATGGQSTRCERSNTSNRLVRFIGAATGGRRVHLMAMS